MVSITFALELSVSVFVSFCNSVLVPAIVSVSSAKRVTYGSLVDRNGGLMLNTTGDSSSSSVDTVSCHF